MGRRGCARPWWFAASPSLVALSPSGPSGVPRGVRRRLPQAPLLSAPRPFSFPLLANEKGAGTGRTRPCPPPCVKIRDAKAAGNRLGLLGVARLLHRRRDRGLSLGQR